MNTVVDDIRKRFLNSPYSFGFTTNDSITYGWGWGQMELYMITVSPDKVIYQYSFATNGHLDKEKELPYTADFIIPKTTAEFEALVMQ